MASQLTKRGYKYRALPTNDKDTFNDFLNDDSEFNMKKLDADLEGLDDKVLFGGERKQNFDFIKNKVVSDNLSKQGIVLSNTDGWITNGSYPYTLIFKTVRLNSASWFLVGNGGWGLSYFDDYICITDVNGPAIQKLFPVKQGEQLSLAIQQTKDGLVEAYSPKHGRVVVENSKLVNLGGGTLRGTGHGYDVDFLIYNRILIQQELQQNFSVLNNTPSIKELHTTDSTGKTSILPTLYKESKKARGTLIEIPYDEPRDLENYIYKFI